MKKLFFIMFFVTVIFGKEPFSEIFDIKLYQKISTGDIEIKKYNKESN